MGLQSSLARARIAAFTEDIVYESTSADTGPGLEAVTPWLPPERGLHPKENFPLGVSDAFIALSKWEFAPHHARTSHVSGGEKDQNECLKTQNITHRAAGRVTVKTSGEMH